MTPHKPLNKILLAAFLSSGLVITSNAMAEPQGLYSTDELTDASVYSKSKPDEEIGEVEDVLLDDAMRVRALVVETGGLFDLGEKKYVVDAGKFTVETRNGDDLDKLEYLVYVDMTKEELAQQPEYTNDWWTHTKGAVRQAWQNTKEGAASAWESTKAAASNALSNIGGAMERSGHKAKEAADSAKDKMDGNQ